jgi:molybdate transport system substrate-binding protein
MQLMLLSAGAAKGLVDVLRERFLRDTGATVDGTFGAVGAMKERLLAGAPCDVLILTQALLDGLADDGRIDRSSIVPLGRVYTGVARRTQDHDVAIESPESLRATLRAATSVHFPDPRLATAGIHFASVLDRLGVRDEIEPRLHAYPNGAKAMTALAAAEDADPVGCTQVTEILYTDGVRLVGKLPPAFELVTVYAASVTRSAANVALAKRFVALLSGDDAAEVRRSGGFE